MVCNIVVVRDLGVGQVKLGHSDLLARPVLSFLVWESEVAVFDSLLLLFFRTFHREGHLPGEHLVSKQPVKVQVDRFVVVDTLDDLWDLVGLPTT